MLKWIYLMMISLKIIVFVAKSMFFIDAGANNVFSLLLYILSPEVLQAAET